MLGMWSIILRCVKMILFHCFKITLCQMHFARIFKKPAMPGAWSFSSLKLSNTAACHICILTRLNCFECFLSSEDISTFYFLIKVLFCIQLKLAIELKSSELLFGILHFRDRSMLICRLILIILHFHLFLLITEILH